MTRVELPWTNVYGTARSLLAAGTLATLLCHDTDLLFRPLGAELGDVARDIRLMEVSLFSLLPGARLGLAKGIAVVILLATAIGWRPRLTGILHWWVSFSFGASCVVVDGGDQVAAVLALLLVPVTLTDPRRWHWSPAPAAGGGLSRQVRAFVASSALSVIRLQIATIYFVAVVAKLGVREWVNGTAVYYWFLHPVFGVDGWRRALMMPLLTHPVSVTILTWGALVLEALLFAGLLAERRYQSRLLWVGILFHSAIAVVHGLVSFALSMFAALILYLRPVEEEFGPRAPRASAAPAGEGGRASEVTRLGA
ncbi:MAG: sporulation-delaying protein SdpB family protein, partial [Gemmatimonadales bacterium]